MTVSDTFASCDARNWDILLQLTCGTFVSSKLCLRHRLCEPTKHAHPDAAQLRRGVTCVDVCLRSTVHAVAHACTLNRAMSRGYEATPMHRKLNRAMARDRKCTHSTRNGHAHAYKARRVNVHWHVIIFGQLSVMVYPRDRTEHKTYARKSEDGGVAREVSVNGVPAFVRRSSAESQEHLSHVSNNMKHIIARRIRHP